MAKHTVINKGILVVLELTESEAFWLREYLRNFHSNGEDESLEDAAIRKEIFDAIPTVIQY